MKKWIIVKLSTMDTEQENTQHAIITKNGVMVSGSYSLNTMGANFTQYTQDIVFCNGTSDYIEPYGMNGATGGAWTNTSGNNQGDNAYISITKVAA